MVNCFLFISAYILSENVKNLEKCRWFFSFFPFSVSQVNLNEDFILFWQNNWYFIFPYFSCQSSICWQCMIHTGCPKKNALLSLEANISGFKGPIGQSWTSFENYMFSAFFWAQEQVNFIPASLRKSGFKKVTWPLKRW